jgi:hypothetical protein
MVIGLLVLLGVELVVIVVIVATLLSRRRWVSRQQGFFRGAVRVSAGDIDGLRTTWARGYGRWVGHTFAWTKAPFLFRTVLLAGDGLVEQRPGGPDEVKRLGSTQSLRFSGWAAQRSRSPRVKPTSGRLAGPFHPRAPRSRSPQPEP